MECTKCKKEIDIPDVVYYNVDAYNKPILAASNCCGTAYIVSRKPAYYITPYTGDSKKDDLF